MNPPEKVAALERRLDHLNRRVSERGDADTAHHYDRAEIAALAWALPILRAEAAAWKAGAAERDRLRRAYGVTSLPPAAEPYVAP